MRVAFALAVLSPLAGCSLWSEKPKPGPRTVAYACEGGVRFDVIFNPESRLVTVLPPQGDALVLLPVETGSGAAWANADFSLRTKGDEALWTEGERNLRCTAQGEVPAQ